MIRTLLIRMTKPMSNINRRTVKILSRQLMERSSVSVVSHGDADYTITLKIDSNRCDESFSIEDSPDGITITGGDDRGLLYGVGKFLHSSHFSEDSFTPGEFRGTSAPAKPIRGIYFATHFHNFYNDAPYSELADYIEDLSLWGYNSITVWFDMHHYRSINEPAAQEMIARLHFILRTARDTGLATGLLVLANEGYADSPNQLRADWTAGHNGYFTEPRGHYHVELCPNKPGAQELLLHWRKEVFDAFADIHLDAICIWPYDQGGCTCEKCAPWGAKGYLKVARPIADLARDMFPKAEIILSTWEFDKFVHGEFDTFADTFDNQDGWVNYLMYENPCIAADTSDREHTYLLSHDIPGGLPLLSFPEISMHDSSPWGGYGANPLPDYLQSLWEQMGDKINGGFPYSEGIFEDINKIICAYFYWHGSGSALNAVREYLAYEVSPDEVETVLRVVQLFERSNHRSQTFDDNGFERFVISDSSGVDEAYESMQVIDDRLPRRVRNSWRWRILYLRSVIDWELKHHDMLPNPRCEDAFDELIRLFHVENGIWSVKPPSKRHPGRIEQG